VLKFRKLLSLSKKNEPSVAHQIVHPALKEKHREQATDLVYVFEPVRISEEFKTRDQSGRGALSA